MAPLGKSHPLLGLKGVVPRPRFVYNEPSSAPRRSLPNQVVVGQASRPSILLPQCHLVPGDRGVLVTLSVKGGPLGAWPDMLLPLKAMRSGSPDELYLTPRSAKPRFERGDGTEMPPSGP